jgi:error-prone DNA polymerase
MVEGMVARGYERDFAERCFRQIQGFGSYGFPESHAIAFARLVWVSSWIKHHFPAIFAAALLNSQPMGFYAPAQIVRDAKEHGVEVRPIDVNASDWDNSIEESIDGGSAAALRLGLRQITGFRAAWAETLVAARPFTSLEDISRAGLSERALRLLADADACTSLGLDRRAAAWEALRTQGDTLPLFAAADARELGEEDSSDLPILTPGEQVAADYQTIRLSLKNHPMALLRPHFAADKALTAAQLNASRNGRPARLAGVVLVRQRPGNGNAIFITLEDETGVANIVIWARLFDVFRRPVMAARLMLVEGEVQRSPEGVVHLMATRIIDRSAALDLLSETHDASVQTARASEVLDEDKPGSYPGGRARHPRDVRILPRSRDFH